MKVTPANKRKERKTETIKEGVFDAINELATVLKKEVALGREMNAIGVSTEFSEMIDSSVKMVSSLADDPKTLFLTNIKLFSNALYQQIEEETIKFLKSRKTLISSAYKTYEGISLHFSIVLKRDTLKNRAKFYEYNATYLQLEYSSIFPIVFQFIPREMEKELKIFSKII